MDALQASVPWLICSDFLYDMAYYLLHVSSITMETIFDCSSRDFGPCLTCLRKKIQKILHLYKC